jgi:peptidoglycan L-alanyl-D-glutamate endopeptidase CwlK
MANLDSAQRDLSVLHPAIRDAVAAIEKQLQEEGHPFRVFEAFRSPQRQDFLFAKGRPHGKVVTNARAWGSFHQYGLAVDFVLFFPDSKNKWSWDDTGPRAKHWKRMHELGAQFGLKPLSFEKPHLEIQGFKIEDLKRGRYPAGGDEAWAENLEGAIAGWKGGGAPPVPKNIVSRPPLDGSDDADDTTDDLFDDIVRPAAPGASANQFARVHAVVEKWEGGFVNHPLDRGGPTNMGITMDTLARWRRRAVTVAEVRNLSRDEAWQIMKAFYYDMIGGDSLSLPLALAVHNAAVLHGVDRSSRFLQRALGAAGNTVEVDGNVGDDTIGAVRLTDPNRLRREFFTIQRAFFAEIERTRPDQWAAFGKGWMNRFNDIKSVADKFTLGDTGMPMPDPLPSGGTSSTNPDLAAILAILLGGSAPDATTPSTPAGQFDVAALLKLLGDGKTEPDVAKLLELLAPKQPDKVLTPVNNAFGEFFGKLLNGRKTGIGIIGTLLASLLGQAPDGLGGSVIGPLLGALKFSTPTVLPIMLALTAWGLLGKVDKWVVQAKK